MDLRKLVCSALVMLVALGLCSVSALSQTRPRLPQPLSDPNDVSCSPEDYALLAPAAAAESKTAWEAKPKRVVPLIDVTPSIGPADSAFFKLQPTLMAAKIGRAHV